MRVSTINNVRGIAESLGISNKEIICEYQRLHGKCTNSEYTEAIKGTNSKPKSDKLVKFATSYLSEKQNELDTHIVAMSNKDYEAWLKVKSRPCGGTV